MLVIKKIRILRSKVCEIINSDINGKNIFIHYKESKQIEIQNTESMTFVSSKKVNQSPQNETQLN